MTNALIPSQKIEERMTSLQIAELTGKSHKNLMRDIRNMESAWEKVHGLKFELMQKEIEIGNGATRLTPYYSLSKLESLYIATKFNDEARAKLVIRWEELERANQPQVPQNFVQALTLALEQAKKIEQQDRLIGEQQGQILELSSAVASMEKKVTYLDKVLACTSTVKVTNIAQDYGMSAKTFNNLLHNYGIQHKCGEQWILYAKYLTCGYVKDVPFSYTKSNGTEAVTSNTQWTQKGRFFLYEFLKEKGIIPLIDQNESND